MFRMISGGSERHARRRRRVIDTLIGHRDENGQERRREAEREREEAKGKGHCRSLSTLKTAEDEKCRWQRVGGHGPRSTVCLSRVQSTVPTLRFEELKLNHRYAK